MRRRKREVLDKDEVFGILARCKTVRIGMFGDRYPNHPRGLRAHL